MKGKLVMNNQEKRVTEQINEFVPMTGKEFWFLRKYFNLTQQSLAKVLKYNSRTTISNMESMYNIPIGQILEFEKYITLKFSKQHWEDARRLYRVESEKIRNLIIFGKRPRVEPKKSSKHRYKVF